MQLTAPSERPNGMYRVVHLSLIVAQIRRNDVSSYLPNEPTRFSLSLGEMFMARLDSLPSRARLFSPSVTAARAVEPCVESLLRFVSTKPCALLYDDPRSAG
jgi:hypothetical protein